MPGEGTTATLVAWHLLPEFEPVYVGFDQFFETVESGTADAGVVIHEGQPNHAEHGFYLLLDLAKPFINSMV